MFVKTAVWVVSEDPQGKRREALLLSPLHCPEEQSGANVPTLNRWEYIERFEFGGKAFGPRVGLFHVCNADDSILGLGNKDGN